MALTDNMVHCWRFNKGSGYAVEDLGSDPVDLTLHDDITWFTDGTWGTGVRYANPGDSNSITRVTISAISGPATLFTLFRQPSIPTQWGGISWNSPGSSQFLAGLTAEDDASVIVQGSWAHHGVTSGYGVHKWLVTLPAVGGYTSDTYVDDTTAYGLSVGAFPFATATNLAIGACDWDNTTYGREFYIVAIWNRILSSDEIQTIIDNPYAMLENQIIGSSIWGYSTNMIEENKRTFTDNWIGTGMILGSGDSEKILLSANNYMESEIVNTGIHPITIQINKYSGSSGAILSYRSGSTVTNCQGAIWNTYSGSFSSLGYAQIRLEKS